MKRLLPAIIIWACFLLVGCTPRFEQEYYQGTMKVAINDTIVEFNVNPQLSWKNYWTSDPDNHSNVFREGHLYMACKQYDTSTVYKSFGSLYTNPDVQPHSSFYSTSIGGGYSGFIIDHPAIGGSYYTYSNNIQVLVNEFGSSRISGSFHGHFEKQEDSSMVYVTCDFDFTP
jgi:hypothetical protein